jgi:hypothetical protein
MEIWMPVSGYEYTYEVSNLGNVRSVDRWVDGRWKLGKLLAQRLNKGTGYPTVTLRYEIATVHTLVAAAFIGPRPTKHDVAHTDGDKTNNRVVNLRYATRKENCHDMVAHGTRTKRLSIEQVTEIKKSLLKFENQYDIANRYGIDQSNVSRIATGKNWGWLCVTSY